MRFLNCIVICVCVVGQAKASCQLCGWSVRALRQSRVEVKFRLRTADVGRDIVISSSSMTMVEMRCAVLRT